MGNIERSYVRGGEDMKLVSDYVDHDIKRSHIVTQHKDWRKY